MKTRVIKPMKDYYQILGIHKNSAKKEIRKKTYQLGKLFHPKKNTSSKYDPNKFLEIIEAYTVLNNELTKEVYDWILDHEQGIYLLSDEALSKHYKRIKIASINGINKGKEYAKSPFWEFRDDFNSTKWWNWIDIIPWP
jgi:DnaJ-class molecular chaperone